MDADKKTSMIDTRRKNEKGGDRVCFLERDKESEY